MTLLMVVGLPACSGATASGGRSESDSSAPASSFSSVSKDPSKEGAASSESREEASTQLETFVEQENVLAAASPMQTALQGQAPETDSKHTAALVAYFSWSGNTKTVAEKIQVQTGADIFEITTVNGYSDDYDTVLNEAQAEQRENARPELNGHVENMDGLALDGSSAASSDTQISQWLNDLELAE